MLLVYDKCNSLDRVCWLVLLTISDKKNLLFIA